MRIAAAYAAMFGASLAIALVLPHPARDVVAFVLGGLTPSVADRLARVRR